MPPEDTAVPKTPAVAAAPAPSAGEPAQARTAPTGPAAEPANTALPPAAAVPRPAVPTRPTSRRPAAKKAVPVGAPVGAPVGGTDPRFENGPLAVVDVADGQVLAYCVGGLVLDVPAKPIPALAEWTLCEGRLGRPKLSGPDKDADPLIVLTEAAREHYGLPVTLTQQERLAGRIPEGHKVIKQLTCANWQLTKRGRGRRARRGPQPLHQRAARPASSRSLCPSPQRRGQPLSSSWRKCAGCLPSQRSPQTKGKATTGLRLTSPLGAWAMRTPGGPGLAEWTS